MRVVARAEVLAAERALAQQAAGQAQVTVPALGQVVVPVGEPVPARAQVLGLAGVSGQAKERAQAAARVQVTVLAQVQAVAPVVEQVPALAAGQGRAEGSGKARWRAGWPG